MPTPRGVRNHNPGNIDRSARMTWRGEDRSDAALQREPRFCVFRTPEHGFRALAVLLRNYGRLHKLRTVRGVIHRWAPPIENDTGAYVRQVAQALDVAADTPIDLEDREVLYKLARAIARHENGGDHWPEAVIRSGVNQAFSA